MGHLSHKKIVEVPVLDTILRKEGKEANHGKLFIGEANYEKVQVPTIERKEGKEANNGKLVVKAMRKWLLRPLLEYPILKKSTTSSFTYN